MPQVTAALLEMRLKTILEQQFLHLKRCGHCLVASTGETTHRVARLGSQLH